jgi:hypothetical protein
VNREFKRIDKGDISEYKSRAVDLSKAVVVAIIEQGEEIKS